MHTLGYILGALFNGAVVDKEFSWAVNTESAHKWGMGGCSGGSWRKFDVRTKLAPPPHCESI